jgi:predicted secreted protein
MSKHIRLVRVSLAALVAVVFAASLVACSQQSASSSAAPGSSSASASVSASSSGASASSATSGTADVVKIGLDYNAGTGYEWKCTMNPEGVASIVSQETEDRANDKTMTGGPLNEVFTVRAEKPGEVMLTFDLVRNWEGEPAETQVYAFTVSNDLKMTLNPYKSNFANEPTWETA